MHSVIGKRKFYEILASMQSCVMTTFCSIIIQMCGCTLCLNISPLVLFVQRTLFEIFCALVLFSEKILSSFNPSKYSKWYLLIHVVLYMSFYTIWSKGEFAWMSSGDDCIILLTHTRMLHNCTGPKTDQHNNFYKCCDTLWWSVFCTWMTVTP